MTEETINFEEEFESTEGQGKSWSAHFDLSASELMDKIREYTKDATVYRLIVRDPEGKTIFDTSLIGGMAMGLIFGPWTLVGLAVAMGANYSIIVIRREGEEAEADSTAATAEDIMTSVDMEVDQCQGLTKSGAQCKRKPKSGFNYCPTHMPA